MNRSVGIIGCGWLGLPLGKALAENGYSVMGSTTSARRLDVLKQNGINPYLLYLNSEESGSLDGIIPETDCLVISVPPRLAKQGDTEYSRQIDQLVEFISSSSIAGIIFISTTSIYPDVNGIVQEASVENPSDSPQPVLVEAENKVIGLRQKGKSVTIARMSGLMGYDRIPGKYVRGKKELETGSVKVNYIHRDDVIAALTILIENGCPNETYNFSAPIHPTRREVYDSSCLQFGWEAPTYKEIENKIDFKVISADKFTGQYDYTYIYPNPLEFNYELPALTVE